MAPDSGAGLGNDVSGVGRYLSPGRAEREEMLAAVQPSSIDDQFESIPTAE